METLPLHGSVRYETEIHLVAGGDERLGDLAATQSAEDCCGVAVPIESLQVVIRALLMLFNFKLVEALQRWRQTKRALNHNTSMGEIKQKENCANCMFIYLKGIKRFNLIFLH